MMWLNRNTVTINDTFQLLDKQEVSNLRKKKNAKGNQGIKPTTHR